MEPSRDTNSPAYPINAGPFMQPMPYAPPRRVWPWAVVGGVMIAASLILGVATVAAQSPAPTGATGTLQPAKELPTAGGSCSVDGKLGDGVNGQKLRCEAGKWAPVEVPTGDEPPPSVEDDLDGPIGTTYTVSGGDAEAEYTLVKTTTKARDTWGGRPDRGLFFVIYVKARVISGSEYVCACSFQFVTRTGKVYESTFSQFKGLEALDAADLGAGQNADGWVAFDVPRSALKGGKIGFKPNVFDGQVAYWSL